MKSSEGIRQCSACGKPDIETALLTIILPPLIRERTDLCEPCLSVAISSNKHKKITESESESK
jgi:hypothetical protein